MNKWLREDEAEEYSEICGLADSDPEEPGWEVSKEVFKSLAECRRLLKKHEWVKSDIEEYCLECEVCYGYGEPGFGEENKIHHSDCALAAQLDGLPRKGDSNR